VLRGHSGLEALGGGSFEEVVRSPLGNCSINTHQESPNRSTWRSERLSPKVTGGGDFPFEGRSLEIEFVPPER
jgi:hypothetical protein